MIEILATKAGGAPAKSDLDAWISAPKLPVTTVMDPPGTGTPTFNVLGPRETAYIINLATMKIQRRILGDTTGTKAPSIDQAVAEILVLLK